MKRLLMILTVLFALIALSSCGREYKPVESTDEEKRVVMTLRLENEEYEIRYELYRMLFLNNRAAVDGGDASVWSGENKDEYIDRINSVIINRSCEIFSVLHLAKELGIDPESKEIEDGIYELVRIGVEGNGGNVQGHGSYEKYLESLKEKNMNYAVQELLFRYTLLLEKIGEYYGGTEHQALGKLPGDFEVTREAVKEYYDGEDAARILYLYFQSGVRTPEEMESYRLAMTEKESDLEVALYIVNRFSPVMNADLINNETKEVSGTVLGRHELDGAIWGEYTDAIFALEPGEVSPVITVTDDRTYYYIAYMLEKSDGHFNAYYDTVKESYIENEIGRVLGGISAGLRESVKYTDGYSSVDHGAAVQR